MIDILVWTEIIQIAGFNEANKCSSFFKTQRRIIGQGAKVSFCSFNVHMIDLEWKTRKFSFDH